MGGVLEGISIVFLLAGAFFTLVGGIGVLRLPDFYTRLHGAGITDTLGAGLILTGLMVQADSFLTVFKLVTVLFFMWITSPTSTHALARSALTNGLEPELDEGEE
jgi:multicomponent Na+:H+ antiporter subunit G